MKRPLPTLLLLLTLGLSACQTASRNPNAPTPPSDAPVKIYDNDTGALLNDRTGQSSAGGGRVVVNNVSQIPALAPAVSPGSSFAYGRFNYSRVNAVAVAQVKSLEDKYKSAQSSLESLVKGGVAAAGGNYAAAAKEAAALAADAYKSWQDAQASLANSPQPSQGAADTEVLIAGPDAGKTLESVSANLGETIRIGLAPGAVNTFTDTAKREDITTEAETLAGLKTAGETVVSLAQIYAAIDSNRLLLARQTGTPSMDKIIDDEDDKGDGGVTPPTPSTTYDKLSDMEQKFLWKSRYSQAMERGIGTIFVPADRPKIKSAIVTFSNGTKQGPSENYFSESQKRQRLVFSSPYPAGPAKAEILYTDGQSETYDLPDAHKRREFKPGAYKGAAPVAPTEPTPPPPAETSAAPAGGAPAELTPLGLLLREDVAATVDHVLVIEDAKTNTTNPPKYKAVRIGNTWTTGRPLSAHRAAVYQIWYSRPPPSPVTYHPNFFGRGPVGHFSDVGWDPDTIR